MSATSEYAIVVPLRHNRTLVEVYPKSNWPINGLKGLKNQFKRVISKAFCYLKNNGGNYEWYFLKTAQNAVEIFCCAMTTMAIISHVYNAGS